METYHQDYVARNPLNPYIVFNAQPKVRKLRAYRAAQEKVATGNRLVGPGELGRLAPTLFMGR